MIRALFCCISVLTVMASSVQAGTIKAKAVTATHGGSAANAQDGDAASAWTPGTADAAITFDFKVDTYLDKLELTASAGCNATLITAEGVKKDITLKSGKNLIDVPSVLTKSLTVELIQAPSGFGLSEASFTTGLPGVSARPRLKAKASTTLDNKKKKYGPQLAIDGKLSTAWNEGSKVAKGQYLEISFDKPAFVHHVGTVVGYSKYNQKIGEVWFKNHRIQAARFDYSDGWYYDATFEDRIDYQYVPIRMETKKTRITIKKVFDTLKWEDTPISEVKFIYEYVDDVKLEAGFDQDMALASSKDPRYVVMRIKGAYAVQADRAPANVVLVVDQSGSMSEQDRMKHAIEAAKLIVGSLGPKDYLSLISFDDDIIERLPPTLMTTDAKNKVVKVIEKLAPDGSTDIHGALTKATELVKRKLSSDYTNRILLLSDGEPTAGNTNSKDIAKVASTTFESKKVITSTFGLGADYNEDLMAGIATGANGAYYHITNPAQMFKVFVAEMSSIMKVLGRNASLSVEFPKGIKVTNVLGHKRGVSGNTYSVPLRPISAADEQRVVFEIQADGTPPKESPVKAKLTYKDALNANKTVTLETLRILEWTDDAAAAKASRNDVVLAEVLSTQAALGLEAAAADFEKGSASSARKALKAHIDKLKKENKYLKSATLTGEIAALSAILKQMSGSASSSTGKLAIKEAKAMAMAGKRVGGANSSLSGAATDPNAEIRRLVSTNFQDPGPMYGSAKPEAIIGMLVGRGLDKKKASTAANTLGYRAYARKDYDEAVSWFDTALGYDANHVLATYNAACTWGLKKDAGKAVEYLERLKGIKNAAAKKRLLKAKKDPDLDSVRGDADFKAFMATL